MKVLAWFPYVDSIVLAQDENRKENKREEKKESKAKQNGSSGSTERKGKWKRKSNNQWFCPIKKDQKKKKKEIKE